MAMHLHPDIEEELRLQIGISKHGGYDSNPELRTLRAQGLSHILEISSMACISNAFIPYHAMIYFDRFILQYHQLPIVQSRIKVAAISGSAADDLIHDGLIGAVVDIALGIPGMVIRSVNTSNQGVNQPIYDLTVPLFLNEIKNADCCLFVTHENNSEPLKNAINWASNQPNVFANKAAAIISAGESLDWNLPLNYLHQIGFDLDLHFIDKPEFHLCTENFDVMGNLIDQPSRERIKEVLDALKAFTLRLQNVIDLVLFCICCVTISGKMMNDSFSVSPFLSEDVGMSQKLGVYYNEQHIKWMEQKILHGFDWNMFPVTPLTFVDYFLSRLPKGITIKRRTINVIIIQGQGSLTFTKFRCSIVAASAVLVACSHLHPKHYRNCRDRMLRRPYIKKAQMELTECTQRTREFCDEKQISIQQIEEEKYDHETEMRFQLNWSGN